MSCKFGAAIAPIPLSRHDLIRMEESVMGDVPELIFSFLTLKLSARGRPALWLVVPIAVVLLAVAWRVLR